MADLRAHELEELDVLTARWDAGARAALHEAVHGRVAGGAPFAAALILSLAEAIDG